MSIKAPQVLLFVASAAGSIALLSIARFGFRTEADSEFWNSLSGAGEKVAEMRAEEAETLHGGKMPIDLAIAKYGSKGRKGFPEIQVKSEGAEPPVAGWIKHPDFEERAAAAKAFTEKAQAEAAAAPAAETPEAAEAEPAAAQ